MMTMYISPYRHLATLREAMDRALEESLSEKTSSEREMLLAADVIVEPEAFVINAFVPGLDAEDLNIEIVNNTVSIRGEFQTSAAENAKYMTNELPSGRFARVVTLPVDIDAAQTEANIKNGFLTLRVPKAEIVRPKSIKVNVN
jgi:HSP20 family protein